MVLAGKISREGAANDGRDDGSGSRGRRIVRVQEGGGPN